MKFDSHGGASVTIGARTSVAHGVAIHGPCSIGEDCFLAMRSTIYSATLGSNVWLGLGAMVMRTNIETHFYVPAGSIIQSSTDVWGLRLVSSKEEQYMKDVLEAANRLRKDYYKMRDLVKVNG